MNNVDICLIIPPSPFLLDERVFMSLGVLKVAASLEEWGAGVEVLDLAGVKNYEDVVRDYAMWSGTICYGITATSPQLPAAVKIAKVIKSGFIERRVILGGPHPTLVNAAWKREKKLGQVGRAHRAMESLKEHFDILVAGDGENAVFQAMASTHNRIIDADDRHSLLWLDDKGLEASPFPARHMVDVGSYKYRIDGVPALSLIAQLGCLAAGTMIEMADGRKLPIEKVKVGDQVICWNDSEKTFGSAPVVAAWNRNANDLLRLETSCATILITSEHPLWTETGWKCAGNVEPRKNQIGFKATSPCIADLSDLRKDLRSGAGISPRGELLQSAMSVRMATAPCESEMAISWSNGDESQMVCDDQRGESGQFEYSEIADSGENVSRAHVNSRRQAGRPQSNEETGSCRESISNNKKELEGVFFGTDEAWMAGRKNSAALAKESNNSTAECFGNDIGSHSFGDWSDVRLYGKFCFLDRSLPVGKETESRLHRQGEQTSYSDARRILAFSEIGGNRNKRLQIEGLGRSSDLGKRIKNEGTACVINKDQTVHFADIISCEFVGKSEVFNLTVCPGHSYVANGLIVHNCPFGCGFCAGRHSPMLRHIRTRSPENIVAEMAQMNLRYGCNGFMFYDDELNVNPGLIDLMDKIAEAQAHHGLEWRLRGFVKAELFTDEQAAAMYRAGFRWILVGFESGSERILENINKKATKADNTRCVEIARRHGLKVKALMSLGHPGESFFTISETVNWLIDVKPDDFDATVITPYPGSPYYDEAVKNIDGGWSYVAKNGDRLHQDEMDYTREADYYKGNPDDGYVSHVWTDSLSRWELITLRDRLERDVRAGLQLPFNAAAPAMMYEHSMGQTRIPQHILKTMEIV